MFVPKMLRCGRPHEELTPDLMSRGKNPCGFAGAEAEGSGFQSARRRALVAIEAWMGGFSG
jgi:hypothetical protein